MGKGRPQVARGGRMRRAALVAYCVAVLVFLVVPTLAVVPISFNAEPYMTITEGMLRLDPDAYSMRWYRNLLQDDAWLRAYANTLIVGISAAAIATTLGTAAAIGLSSDAMPARNAVTALLLSPLVTPVIISSFGMFFFYAAVGLGQTYTSLIISHAVFGTPFVVIAVLASMSRFDRSLVMVAESLGAGPLRIFWRIHMPFIAPGVIAGAFFAFAISFDDIVAALFLAGLRQRTLMRQLWTEVSEQISPESLAVTTILVFNAIVLLVAVELLRRWSEWRRRSRAY